MTTEAKEMLTNEEFSALIEKSIRAYLPEEYAAARIERVNMRKISGHYSGMQVIKDGQGYVPVINLDMLYRAYKNGTDWEGIMKTAARIVLCLPALREPEDYDDYSVVKNHLIVRVSSMLNSSGILDEMPHIVFEDIVLTCHVMDRDLYGGSYSFGVTYGMLESFRVSEKTLINQALSNSMRLLPPMIVPTDCIISMAAQGRNWNQKIKFETGLKKLDFEHRLMYTLTNEKIFAGAAAMFYPNVLKRIADRAMNNLILLPSSVHEVIIIEERNDVRPEFLKEMVTNINNTRVRESERLSYNVFFYNQKKKQLSVL